MFIARFSYDIVPKNRQAALDLIKAEAAAAAIAGRIARVLIPLTRGRDCVGLQFELELSRLDELEQFRQEGVGDGGETRDWMRKFDEILETPPVVEIYRVSES